MPPEIDNSQALDKMPAPLPGADTWQRGQNAPVGAAAGQGGVEAASQRLVQSNVIPDLQLTDRTTDAGTTFAPTALTKDWTVAIDLGVSLPGHKNDPVGAGVDRELPQLLKLAKETEGKSVTFVVHAERPTDNDGILCVQHSPDQIAPCVKEALNNSDIERGQGSQASGGSGGGSGSQAEGGRGEGPQGQGTPGSPEQVDGSQGQGPQGQGTPGSPEQVDRSQGRSPHGQGTPGSPEQIDQGQGQGLQGGRAQGASGSADQGSPDSGNPPQASPEQGNPDPGSAAQGLPETTASEYMTSSPITTERYFIHDGKIDRMPNEDYPSADQDLTALVKEAGMLAPSKNLGLIAFTHGGGSSGINTNLGPISLDQTVEDIQQGLEGTGHEKLDLLDYDSCDMGQTKVLDQSRLVAQDVVASAAYESASKSHDGQNLNAAMHALLANTHMTGSQFGDEIVEQARDGANGKGADNATQTLANFDLTKYDTFQQSLNQFGKALKDLAANDDNAKAMRLTIDMTTVPETGDFATWSHGRDLRELANNILADSQKHVFSGDTKPLEDASKGLINSMDSMVTSSQGEKEKHYEYLGGLTASVPGDEILDSKNMAKDLSPLKYLNKRLQHEQPSKTQMSDQEAVVHLTNNMLNSLAPKMDETADPDIQKLLKDRDVVAGAENIPSLRVAIHHLQQDTARDENGPLGRRVERAIDPDVIIAQTDYLHDPVDQVAPDWDAFVRRIQEQAR